MNKRNDSVTEAEKQELLRISRETRERIIAEMERSQIFQRRRKLTSYADLFDALFKYLAEGLSFYRLASYMDCSRGDQAVRDCMEKADIQGSPGVPADC